MRRSIFSHVLLLLVFVAGCQDLGQPLTDDMLNYTGTIIEKNTGFYLIESDMPLQQGKMFYPTNLPESFKRDGLRVRFSGSIDALPGVEYLYPPLKLSSIAVIQH